MAPARVPRDARTPSTPHCPHQIKFGASPAAYADAGSPVVLAVNSLPQVIANLQALTPVAQTSMLAGMTATRSLPFSGAVRFRQGR